MNRRAFLGLIAAVAGATLDPERLLWVPGQKTIFIPKVVAVRNVFVPPDWIATEALRMLRNNLLMSMHINRRYDEDFRHDAHLLAIVR